MNQVVIAVDTYWRGDSNVGQGLARIGVRCGSLVLDPSRFDVSIAPVAIAAAWTTAITTVNRGFEERRNGCVEASSPTPLTGLSINAISGDPMIVRLREACALVAVIR